MKSKGINSALITSLATGAIVGTTAYMMKQNKQNSQDNVKKYAGKALKTVGSVIENASYMIK